MMVQTTLFVAHVSVTAVSQAAMGTRLLPISKAAVGREQTRAIWGHGCEPLRTSKYGACRNFRGDPGGGI